MGCNFPAGSPVAISIIFGSLPILIGSGFVLVAFLGVVGGSVTPAAGRNRLVDSHCFA